MITYHKIPTVFKRDPSSNYKTLLFNNYATDELEYLQDNRWVFTEKVDGTCCRAVFDKNEIRLGGKTDSAQIPSSLVNRFNNLFLLQKDKFIEMFSDDVCLYMEGYGKGIQSGGNYRQDQDFVLFDIKYGDWWLQRTDVKDIAEKLEIDIVPIVGIGNLNDMVKMAENGFKSQWGDFIAEGIVARPEIELKTRAGKRIITKIKHKDFKI